MSCPNESQLIALAAGMLEPVPVALEAHIDTCVACQAAVVAAAAADPRPADRSEQPVGLSAAGLVTEAPGRYEVLGECGHGGQSRVLRVFDHRLEREVALKELETRGEVPIRRFLREVRIVGELAHPAVVPVHEVGVRPSGAPYYTMPLVQGRTLAAVVAELPDFDARLRLLPQFVQICHAVSAAHDRRILHRDIKPDNIMLGLFGQAFLLDWGLAKFYQQAQDTGVLGLDDDPDDADFTRQGDAVGTPAYMSPEQAMGDLAAVDMRSDVWSLGAALFYLLSARPAFAGSSAEEVMSGVVDGRRHDLRVLEPRTPPELVAIVDRAMRREPGDRYPGAAQMADDLVAYQSGGRVGAYDYSPRERALRLVRRYRILLAAAVAVFATLAVALVVVVRSYGREADQRRRAEDARAAAERDRERAERASTRSYEQSRVAMGHLARAHAEKAERLRDEHKPLRARVYAASSLLHNPTHRGSPFHDPSAASLLADGDEVLARAATLLLRADNDAVEGLVAHVPVAATREPREIEHAIVEGRLVYAVADGGDAVQVHGLDDRADPMELPGHTDGAMDVALSRSGRLAVTRDATDHLRLWALPAGTLLAMWHGPTVWGTTVAVSDSGVVAHVDEQQRIVVRDPESGVLRRVGSQPRPTAAIAFSADGQRLAVGDHEGQTVVLDLVRGRPVDRWHTHRVLISDLAFAPDDATLAIAGGDGLVVVCRPGVRAPVQSMSGHRGGVSSLVFSAAGTRLFTAAVDGQVRGYDVDRGEQLFELEGPGGHVYEVGVQGSELVALSGGGIRRWTLRSSRRVHHKPRDVRNRFVRYDDGALAFPGVTRPVVVSVDLDRGAVRTLALPDVEIPRLVSPVDQTLVSSHTDGRVVWWARVDDPAGEQLVAQVTRVEAESQPLGFAAHPSGAMAAIDAGGGVIALVPRDPQQPARRLVGHERRVLSLAFSASGGRLASAGYDGAAMVWNVAEGSRVATLREGSGPVESIAFVDEHRIVAAGEFGVMIWSAHDGAFGEPVSLSSEPHRLVLVDRDAQHVAATDDEGRVAVWTLPEGRRVLDVRGRSAVQGLAFDLDDGGLWLVRSRTVEWLPLDRSRFDEDAGLLLQQAERAAGMTLAGVHG